MNPQADIVLAYRLMYYCDHAPMVTDQEYDELEKAARETVGPDHLLNKVGADNREDYPPRIRALALYLKMAAYEEQGAQKPRKGKRNRAGQAELI